MLQKKFVSAANVKGKYMNIRHFSSAVLKTTYARRFMSRVCSLAEFRTVSCAGLARLLRQNTMECPGTMTYRRYLSATTRIYATSQVSPKIGLRLCCSNVGIVGYVMYLA